MKTVILLFLAFFVGSAWGQNDNQKQSQIVLTSPNGQRSITIMARDDTAGLWITCGKRVICVIDTNDYNAVGIYKDTDNVTNGFDAYLSAP